jgi:hypothetical protein
MAFPAEHRDADDIPHGFQLGTIALSSEHHEIGLEHPAMHFRYPRSCISFPRDRMDVLGEARMIMREHAPVAMDGAAARLKEDIDRGRTGDKVDWPDPAAAPLGTDDEAGGNCTNCDTVERTRRAEIAHRSVTPRRQHSLGAAWFLVLFVLAAASAIVLLLRQLVA